MIVTVMLRKKHKQYRGLMNGGLRCLIRWINWLLERLGLPLITLSGEQSEEPTETLTPTIETCLSVTTATISTAQTPMSAIINIFSTLTAIISSVPSSELSAMKIVGYFPEWRIYGRNYYVKNIETSGSISKLTHINYSFANISSDYKCQIGDSYTVYDKVYDAASSINGSADIPDTGVPRGNFN
jgi:hypothetical protein